MTTTVNRAGVPPQPLHSWPRTTAPAAPGPAGGAQAWRNLRRFARNAPMLFQELRQTYGDTVRLPLGCFTVHLPFAPDDISYVLQEGNRNFVRGKGYDFFRIFMGTGLLTTDGEEWKTRRRIVNPLFHHRAVEAMCATMVSATRRVLDRWERENSGGTLDVVPQAMHITLDALGSVMFDRDLENDHDRVGPAMDRAIEAMVFRGEPRQLLPSGTPFGYQRRIRGARAELHDLVADIVTAHRRGSQAGRVDLVSLLLAAQDEDAGTLSDDDVRDELMTIFMAGHETIGTGLAWVLAELARHPDIQEAGHAEVERVLTGREPTLADLPTLGYVRQIVDETLRLHPPIWVFPRDAVADDVIGGHRVPAGESVFLCPYVTHRHPDLWAAPHTFDPDRFAPGRIARLPKFAYFPFGGGQRKCIGSAIALQQSYLSTAMILQRFVLRPAPDLRLDLGTLVSLRPLSGLPLRVDRRTP
ncbi:MAG: cytochrome P450 [Tetrasphaera sp.]